MDSEEKAISVNEGNLDTLRTNLDKKLVQSDMRKRLIGGISEEDVSIYIESIRHDFQLIEAGLNKQVDELQASKEEVLSDFEKYKRTHGEDKAKLLENIESTMSDMSYYKDECGRLESKIAQLEKELAESSNPADNTTDSFKSGIDVIYNQLVNLKDQMNVNDTLQQQLENERLRTEKAEKEKSRLKEWLSELSDSFKAGKNRIDIQSAKIEEKYAALQSDIQFFRTELKEFYINIGMEIDDLYAVMEGEQYE